jgi:hypothetical protein
MPEETVHEVHVHLTRERAPIRKATLAMTGDEVTFGVPGWQGEHYGFARGTVEEHPGTLDYLVASVGGCLIGTFGGTLRARGITATGDDLHVARPGGQARGRGAGERGPRRPLPQRALRRGRNRDRHRARLRPSRGGGGGRGLTPSFS